MTIDLDKIFEFLNSLGGMPKCGLVFIFCLALGWALKKCPWIHNNAIPTIVILAGMVVLPMLSDWEGSALHSVRVFILTQSLIGFITAAISLIASHVLLRPMLAKFGMNGNTEFLTKPPEPETKPKDQQ